MKVKVLIFILTVFFTDIKSANISNPEHNFIRWYLESYGSHFDGKTSAERKTVFSDQLGTAAVNVLKQYLLKDSIINQSKTAYLPGFSDTLILTKNEKAQIMLEINQMSGKTWYEEFMPDSKLLKGEDLTGSTVAVEVQPFFSFSKPIFLRNNSICIFYCSYNCGNLCASAELSVFYNKKGRWRKMFEIERWIS